MEAVFVLAYNDRGDVRMSYVKRSLDFRRFPESIEPVIEAHDRMFPDHARAGVAHDDTHLFPPLTLIAMHRALGTGWFFGTKAAALQARIGIVQELFAVRAQFTAGVMMIAAINVRHRRHGFPFAGEAFFSEVILRFPGRLHSGNQFDWFSGHFHAEIVSQAVPLDLDLGQS